VRATVANKSRKDGPRVRIGSIGGMALAQSNGITVEYHERGEGEPLLLVMGLGGQLIDWPQGFVEALVARGFRVISFDNRDAGLSTEIDADPPTRPELAKAIVLRRPLAAHYNLADMASDAIGLLDVLGVPSAHVVGMSMGGMIAQQIAIDHPDRVRSLTSIMSTTGNPRVGRPKMRLVRKAMRRKDPTIENAIELSIETFRDVCGPTFDVEQFRVLAEQSIARSFRPNGTARQLAAIIASPHRTEALGRLKMPALVIHGMLDPLVRPSGGLATARAIPGAKLVMFNDMAHDLPHTRWDDMADEIASIAARAPQPVGAAS
jgi:pimeloyl-ACP methyl ester carboxylesterase